MRNPENMMLLMMVGIVDIFAIVAVVITRF